MSVIKCTYAYSASIFEVFKKDWHPDEGHAGIGGSVFFHNVQNANRGDFRMMPSEIIKRRGKRGDT